MADDIYIFTTPLLDRVDVVQYCGLVTSRNVRAVNMVRDLFTSFRDIFGGRSESYQEVMEEMEREVLAEIKNEVRKVGGNAVIGFSLDFDNIGSKGKSLLMAYGRGTAVILKPRGAA